MNRQLIFFCADNWAFFVRKVRHYFKAELADIIAYSLMPNGYHPLVYIKCGDAGLKIMQPFTVLYTKTVNKQRRRSERRATGLRTAAVISRIAGERRGG